MNNIRRVDDLGRIVLPKEIIRILKIKVGDPFEVNVNTQTGQIIIERYEEKPTKNAIDMI